MIRRALIIIALLMQLIAGPAAMAFTALVPDLVSTPAADISVHCHGADATLSGDAAPDSHSVTAPQQNHCDCCPDFCTAAALPRVFSVWSAQPTPSVFFAEITRAPSAVFISFFRPPIFA